MLDSNLLVLFLDPNDSVDDAPLDILFAEAMKIVKTYGEVLWFRENPPQRLPKMLEQPKPQHLKRIIFVYTSEIEQLFKELATMRNSDYPPKLYQFSSQLKSLILEIYQANIVLDQISAGILLSFCKNFSNWTSPKFKQCNNFPSIIVMRKDPALMMVASLYANRILEWDSNNGSFNEIVSKCENQNIVQEANI